MLNEKIKYTVQKLKNGKVKIISTLHRDLEHLVSDVFVIGEAYDELNENGKKLKYRAVNKLSLYQEKQDKVFENVTDIQVEDGKILVWEDYILSAVLHSDEWELFLVKEDDCHV